MPPAWANPIEMRVINAAPAVIAEASFFQTLCAAGARRLLALDVVAVPPAAVGPALVLTRPTAAPVAAVPNGAK